MALWSILIASVYARHGQLCALLAELDRQAAWYGNDKVRIVVDRDDGTMPVGEKRTRLIECAGSRYVSFVDDDDMVSDLYVHLITAALDREPGPDYVGFQVGYTVDGVPQRPVYHSLAHPRWSEDEHGFYRGISHLNPVRRDAALLGLPFLPGFGEDAEWARRVAATGLVQTERYLPCVLYEYRYSTSGSLFRAGPKSTGLTAPALPQLAHVEELNG